MMLTPEIMIHSSSASALFILWLPVNVVMTLSCDHICTIVVPLHNAEISTITISYEIQKKERKTVEPA